MIADWLRGHGIPWFIRDEAVSGRPFVTEAVSGVIRWRRWLEHVISKIAKRPPPAPVLPHLLLGLYQLLIMDDVPCFAAVNETVESAREAGLATPLVRFLNGALRTAAAFADTFKKERLILPAPIRESYPDILYSRWAKEYGNAAALSLCEWSNTRPCVVVRPRPDRISLEKYSCMLKEAGIRASPHPFDPKRFLIIESSVPASMMPGYEEGLFYVQDPATAVAVDLLDPRPGQKILDACAAPGGKTALIADSIATGRGEVAATDCNVSRLHRLRQNLRRLRIDNVFTAKLNAADMDEVKRFCKGKRFDRILIDAPCTSTGVIRRRPDIKWRFSETRLQTATRTQKMLLLTLSEALEIGGRLVYCTCSMEPEENEQLICSFLRDNVRLRLLVEKKIWPPETKTDGAYAAVLERTA